MLPKLILIIIAAGATACALLVNRQHRIDTAHEIAVVHQRMVQQEQTLWRLRSEITARTRPDQIRERVEKIGGQWVAIPARPAPTSRPTRFAAAEADTREEADADDRRSTQM